MILRTHNVEYSYYRTLACMESNLFKRFYYWTESLKLRNYEKHLPGDIALAAITESDRDLLRDNKINSFLLPAFHSNESVQSMAGHGNYILFHSDLSISENIDSLSFFIRKVKPQSFAKFIVAGRKPSKALIGELEMIQNLEIVADPDQSEMENLVKNAHINLVHARHKTGMKLKLLSALFQGRHCIANSHAIESSGIESLCHLAQTKTQWQELIQILLEKPFTENEIEERRKLLQLEYSNSTNIKILLQHMDF